MKKKIIVLYGGRSAEKEVSVLSAFSVLSAVNYHLFIVELVFIDSDGTWIKGAELEEAPKDIAQLHLNWAKDELETEKFTGKVISPSMIYQKEAVVFPILHGPMGEDGTIQGFLETINMPYVGAGVLASANAMDKIMTKHLLKIAGIPQVPYVPVTRSTWQENPQNLFEQCEKTLTYPMFVKPANMGSSVGISKVEDQEALQKGLELAFRYDSRVLVEQGVHAREIEVAILGNNEVKTTLAGEVVKEVDFYDYNAKYIDNKIEMQIPARVSNEIQEKVRDYAKKAYEILDGSGLSRCDFFLTKENEVFLNELNTMPGFTKFSMYPLLWENMGLGYTELIEELISLAQERFLVRQGYFEETFF